MLIVVYLFISILENLLTKKVKFEQILKNIPKNLRLEVLMFVYKQAICKVKLLQNRDSRFYADILPKLKAVEFKQGEAVLRQGAKPLECCIVIDGNIINILSKRSYGEGSIFGITDIIYKRRRLENFVAAADSNLLMFERADFEAIMLEFPEIEKEGRSIAEGRNELIQAVLKDIKHKEETAKKQKQEEMAKQQRVGVELMANIL